jgi:myo-inositol-1(or 4)-monophosphatase
MPASPLMTVMMGAARKAGRSLVRDFGEVEQLQVSIKGPANFVSAADHRAEDIIFTELSKARPGYGFLMEERGEVTGSDTSHRWIVDPLDGTTNFLHSNPIFAISIGLERSGELVAGLVYNPVLDEMFMAEKGKGAFVADRTGRDRRIRVAARKKLEDALLTTGIPHRGRPQHGRFLRETEHLMKEVSGIRRTGSAATDLAWVAAGRFDAYYEHNLGAWDIAAGAVLVREAGGIVTDTSGGDKMLTRGDIVAANSHLQKDLVAALAEAMKD